MLPAFALGAELMARGHRVMLVSDDRGQRIPGVPDGMAVELLPAGRMTGGPLGWVRGGLAIARGRRAARRLIRDFAPTAVAGFGGYPSLPTLLAASSLNVPMLIHEQNAVLGRVNRLMAGRVQAIATAYRRVQRLDAKYAAKVHMTGNPVRADILALRAEDFIAPAPGGIIRLLVIGGSLGATILSDVVPAAIAVLPRALAARLQVVQQCRAEDVDRVRAAYTDLGVPAVCEPYFADMARLLGDAHLFIGRAGASTVAEIGVAGRPAVFVPFPGAMDDHQRHNVADLVQAGGAWALAQPDFTPAALAKLLQRLADDGDALAHAAAAAARCGLPMATQDLADLMEQVGGAPMMDVIRVGAAQGARRQTAVRPSGAARDGDG